MEGIYDGLARDDCFYCALLYPERYSDDCPRCGRRMRYQPAVLAAPDHIRHELHELWDAFAEAGDAGLQKAALERLLIRLHRDLPLMPAGLDELESLCGCDITRLRHEYQRLFEADPAS